MDSCLIRPTEHVEFRVGDGGLVVDLTSPAIGYLSFLGIVSHTPINMIFHFKTEDTGISCWDSSAYLTGETFSGQAIEGSEFIQTVGCK